MYYSGVTGGFDVGASNFEFDEVNTLVVLPEWKEIGLDDPDIPPEVEAYELLRGVSS